MWDQWKAAEGPEIDSRDYNQRISWEDQANGVERVELILSTNDAQTSGHLCGPEINQDIILSPFMKID